MNNFSKKDRRLFAWCVVCSALMFFSTVVLVTLRGVGIL